MTARDAGRLAPPIRLSCRAPRAAGPTGRTRALIGHRLKGWSAAGSRAAHMKADVRIVRPADGIESASHAARTAHREAISVQCLRRLNLIAFEWLTGPRERQESIATGSLFSSAKAI